jgi:HD-GYP domain-containing protein (c-di-GMP phosphodiesterase class II)
MNLIPFSAQHLRLNEALPFGVRDVSGRLLLSAGQTITDPQQLAHLRTCELYADEKESSDWRRKLSATVDAMIRQNATLKNIAQARPNAERTAPSFVEGGLSFSEQWSEICAAHDGALRDARPGTDWISRVLAVRQRVRRLTERRLDASMCLLIWNAGQSAEKYSSHHSLLCMLVAGEAARLLGWSAQSEPLEHAALTMNAAMTRLQDLLALKDADLSPDDRAEIAAHPERGARLLQESGVDDTLWCDIVRHHHDQGDAQTALAQLTPARRLARLLRRVDSFTAQISRRASRLPMSPVQAARDACLTDKGTPDEIGGALLKAMGLYPPGSYVELINGETAIVLARGRQANQPVVASLVAPNGTPLGEPALRETMDRRFAVKSAVNVQRVKVRPPLERLLARTQS